MQILPLFSLEEVEARIATIAERLYRDYADSPLTIVCIAEGARRFVEELSELLGRGNVQHETEFVVVRRTRGMELCSVQVDRFDHSVLDGRDVLVVDDIADAGVTLRAVLEIVALAETRSVRTAVLVDKRERRREDIVLDYVGFVVESGWVVGYGMDVDGEFRDLDEIGVVSPDTLPDA
jgi:hypoxanthine phosphoribosyltransferase